MASPDDPIAYLDESTSGNVYVIAAAVLEHRSDQQNVRRLTRDAAPSGFHAVSATADERLTVEGVLLHTRGVRGVVTVCAPIAAHGAAEAVRQRCLATLATRLYERHNVRDLVMDSREDLRQPAGQRIRRTNELDQRNISGLRETDNLAGLAITFRGDDREPLLWLADAAAWRTRSALVHQDPLELRRLAPVTDLIEADVLPVRDRHPHRLERTGLQHHLNLFRAEGLKLFAGEQADRALRNDEPDQDLYHERERVAIQRVEQMRTQFEQALRHGQARKSEHYFGDPPAQEPSSRSRGLT